ncbi:hypothetical protein COBT_002876, partial [Conglomerata obtusa]
MGIITVNMSPDEFETFICSQTTKTLIEYLMHVGFLPKEAFYLSCKNLVNLVEYRRNLDKNAWRCMFKKCKNYKKYFSIRIISFFNQFKIELKQILKTIIRYSCLIQRYSINLCLDHDEKIIRKRIDALINY